MDESGQASAIPLVAVEDGRFVMNEQAVRFVESLTQPIAVIACAGAYRQGKSLFLNRGLLQVPPGEGFAVGSTTNACTKGLWIHTQPIQVARKKKGANSEQEYTNVLIIDTEGLGAFKATDTHDSKIFALALLLCSYFIYNSMGKIDEDAIGKLSLVCNVCKQVRAQAADATAAIEDSVGEQTKKRRRVDASEVDKADQLAEFFPHFLWLLRDFSLLLEDEDGNEISARQYLENALADKSAHTGGNSSEDEQIQQSIEQKNNLRTMLRKVFVHRDCETLMRPCVDEKHLQQLNTLGDEVMRPEFLQQLQQLRRKVLLQAPHKLALGNKPVSGRGLIHLCRSYVDAFNRGAAPVIRDSWNMLVEVQCRDAIDSARTVFVTTLSTLLQKHCQSELHSLTRVQLDQIVEALVEGQRCDVADETNFQLQLLPPLLEDIFEQSRRRALQHYNSECGAAVQKSDRETFVGKLTDDMALMCGRVRTCNAKGLEAVISRTLDTAEANVLPKIQSHAEQQFLKAQSEPSLWPTLRFRALWDQLITLIDNFMVTNGGIRLDDRTVRALVDRKIVLRHEKWAQAIEQHWLALLRRTCDTVGSANQRFVEALDEAKRREEDYKDRCDKACQQTEQVEKKLAEQCQQSAEQRQALESAIEQRQTTHEKEKQQWQDKIVQLEKQLRDAESDIASRITEFDVAKSSWQTELEKCRLRADSLQDDYSAIEKRCAEMSITLDSLHDENESLRERLQSAEQTVSQLRCCEAELQQAQSELKRISQEYGAQIAQLERDSVASLSKIRSTNERAKREAKERFDDLQQRYAQLQAESSSQRATLQRQLSAKIDLLVKQKQEAAEEVDRMTAELHTARERIVQVEQNSLDSDEQHQRALQEVSQNYEQKLNAAVHSAREDAKQNVTERATLQKQLNEAATEAACLKVRNEHLQSKLQDEASRGELQQAKKDLDRATQLSEKLRKEKEKLLAQHRAHQHELQERERRIEQMQKKMQEQEREFSAERLRLRLRFEEESAQKSYRKTVQENGQENSDEENGYS